MRLIKHKSGSWNYISGGGADDDHKRDCNDYDLGNMVGDFCI